MPQGQYGVSLSAGGVSIQKTVNRTGDGTVAYEGTIAAGKAGTLTTRTDNDTGILTVSSGHGILDTDTVDVYWSGGRRYGVDVTAVTSTTISIDLGSGDNLPSTSTAIVVMKQTSISLSLDADNAKIFGVSLEFADPASTSKGHVNCLDSGASQVGHIDLTANAPMIYDIEAGVTNPLTGNVVTTIKASHGDGSNSATLKILAVVDATP